MNTFMRVGLWIGSVLFSVTLFSLLLSLTGSFFIIFQVAITFALPVGLLYLPIVALLKTAQGWRMWVTLVTGTLVGPASLALWGVILQLRGGNAHTIWQGDGIGLGVAPAIILASLVGLLTTAIYVIVLKVLHRRICRQLAH
jgi:hypothetical protein